MRSGCNVKPMTTQDIKGISRRRYLLMPNQLQPATLASTIPLIGNEHGEWLADLRQTGSTIGWIDDHPEELGEIRISPDVATKVDYPFGPVTTLMLRDCPRRKCNPYILAILEPTGDHTDHDLERAWTKMPKRSVTKRGSSTRRFWTTRRLASRLHATSPICIATSALGTCLAGREASCFGSRPIFCTRRRRPTPSSN